MIIETSDLALLLGAPVDDNRAGLLIELATQLASSIVDPLPDTARPVILGVALRAYVNPQNVQSQSAGPFQESFSTSAVGGLYLTKQDRAALLRLAGRGGAFTVDPTPADAGAGLSPWGSNTEYYPDGWYWDDSGPS